MDEEFYKNMEEVSRAFNELGRAAKEYTEQVEANMDRWKVWMAHRNNNNWLRMHGYPMRHRKRYKHAGEKPAWKNDKRRRKK